MTTIYFIKPVGSEGPVKIGCSKFSAHRLASIATWSPIPLEIVATAPGTFEDEKFIHSCFADQHSHREWFHPSAKLTAAIRKVAKTGSLAAILSTLKPIGSIRAKGKGSRAEQGARKGYRSYNSRIWWAHKRRRDAGFRGELLPPDVNDIMNRWSGMPYRNIAGKRPTPKEFERLEAFLASPDDQFIRWDDVRVAA